MIPKLGDASCYAVWIMFMISYTVTPWMIYFASIHSVIKYERIFFFFWGGGILLVWPGPLYIKKRIELWLVLGLEVHVEGYLKIYIFYPSDVTTYFH